MKKEWVVYAAAGAVLAASLLGYSYCSSVGINTHADLDDEAEGKAREYFESIVATCGSDYYAIAN